MKANNLSKVLLVSLLSTTLVSIASSKEEEFLKPSIPSDRCYVEIYVPTPDKVVLARYMATFVSNEDKICLMIDASYTYNGFITYRRTTIPEGMRDGNIDGG